MKPLKRAKQKNVEIDHDFYTIDEYDNLLNIDGVFDLRALDYSFEEENHLRISLEFVKDLKVILNEYGYYSTVAIMKTNEMIYINL